MVSIEGIDNLLKKVSEKGLFLVTIEDDKAYGF